MPVTASAGLARRSFLTSKFAAPAVLLSTMALSATAQTFPYVPTTVLLPELPGEDGDGGNIAYIFRPNDEGSDVELLSLNVSAAIDGDTKLETLSSDLPFLKGAPASTAFLPAVAANGSLIIQAGDCQSSSGPSIWTYIPDDDGSTGDWSQIEATVSSDSETSAGPNFLGAAISFSSTVAPDMSDPILYSYGGMCANPSSDSEDWQANATYSETMVKLSSDSDDSKAYAASFPSSRKGPAYAQAGFTLTPLSPSITENSDSKTQKRSYLMLGGHTEQAFINMSIAAVWNLPEESWSFLSINGPADEDAADDESDEDHGVELAVKDTSHSKRSDVTGVESRSGHTTVLSEDGESLIILGGWLGSVSQAAEPQLAVLKIGDSFGDWEWTVPDEQPDGTGIYGHGAALLPGNVMMVYGGYEISDSSSKVKRQEGGGASPQFLNLTSMSWGSSYTNPSYSSSENGGGNSNNDGNDESGNDSSENDDGNDDDDDNDDNDDEFLQRLGLGLGLGLGTVLVLGAVLAWCCYRRKLKRDRTSEREKAVRDLAQDASRFHADDDDIMEKDDPWGNHGWYTGGQDPYDTGARSLGYQTLRDSRNNLGGYGGPQSMGGFMSRKPILRGNRGSYQQAPNGLTTPGDIHPIYEADEEDPDEIRPKESEARPITPASPTYSDPFATPVGGPSGTAAAGAGAAAGMAAGAAGAGFFAAGRSDGRTPSPERPRQIDPEVQGWQTDVGAAEALLAQANKPPRSRNSIGGGAAGRTSPTRRNSLRSPTPGNIGDDERTASGLSERSAVSSIMTRSGSNAGKKRMAAAAAAGAAGALAGTAMAPTTSDGRVGTSGSSSDSSNNTYSTAKSNFQSLQAEGPSLLHRGERSHSKVQSPGHKRGSSYPYSDAEEEVLMPGSPSKNKPRRNRGWLGSIRRVFSVNNGSSGDSASGGDSMRSISPVRRSSFDGAHHDESSHSYESPLTALTGLGGAELLRRKQGRRGWDDGQQQQHGEGQKKRSSQYGQAESSDLGDGRLGGQHHSIAGGGKDDSAGEEDWDIEKAIEKRLVQVMFTVPRERLRVVNGDEAELDRQEEEAVVVDPSKEEGQGPPGMAYGGQEGGSNNHNDEKRASTFEDVHGDAPSPEPLRIHKKRSMEPESGRQTPEPGLGPMSMQMPERPAQATLRDDGPVPTIGPAPLPTPAPTATSPDTATRDEDLGPWAPVTPGKKDKAEGSLRVPSAEEHDYRDSFAGDRSSRRLSSGLGLSPTADSFADSISEPRPSLTLRTAEAVRFERPRGKVLEMVENFEGRSRSNSPSKSVKSLGRE